MLKEIPVNDYHSSFREIDDNKKDDIDNQYLTTNNENNISDLESKASELNLEKPNHGNTSNVMDIQDLLPNSEDDRRRANLNKLHLDELKLVKEKVKLSDDIHEIQSLNTPAVCLAKRDWDYRLKPVIEKILHDSNKAYNSHIVNLENQIVVVD